ncbi:MAG: DUF1934 domain-containing protein [Muribaculaceae bacterium]|nr:DUF1934 domain-containing protein [Muribaculaceae bacterium]
MKRDVLISVRGLQLGTEDGNRTGTEQIESFTSGVYYEKDGRHYVLYEERMEGAETPVKNTVKFAPGSLELIRKGFVNVHMVFEENKKNKAVYQIPYGSIPLEIDTKKIHIARESEGITVHVDYVLDIGYDVLADCSLVMEIRFKENG